MRLLYNIPFVGRSTTHRSLFYLVLSDRFPSDKIPWLKLNPWGYKKQLGKETERAIDIWKGCKQEYKQGCEKSRKVPQDFQISGDKNCSTSEGSGVS